MKTTRMIVGIISMVLFLIVSFQSCAVGIGNTLMENGETSGSSGILLSFCLLIAGIIATAARKSKGGTITALCFYVLGGLFGLVNVGIFADLKIWSTMSFIFAAVLLITLILDKKKKQKPPIDNTTISN